ncbi:MULTISPECIES: amino acid ABC transporter permease [Streptomycetaceae]|uniref:amino acid ABC transporter permease n=1 Tax=Streptomycetaceae TaxID=2062 RepID=UPI000CDCCBD3|nr:MULTISPECIES: amino acid ABC transporter permease [Streptomycetaceae]AUY49627.1 amino acid ABC transporter permease [Streptomyces sp. CB01881]MBP0453637.1 amino acid ABC transporter permease [Kitasatospora sp. RG8]TYC73020.1 amino acid ABC transporter permease [Streptomyces sp. CB01881]
MGFLFEDGNFALFRDGFLQTIELSALSALLALLLGTLLAAFRVSPVPVLRGFGTAWVTLFRNTPLTVLFFAVVFGLPPLGVHLSYLTYATLALGSYTASFVCEVLRSGINTVPLGQAEAARSLGMTFGQTLTQIVLPQAARTVLAPMSSVFIALPRNSAIAGAFSVTELYSFQQTMSERGYSIFAIFFWVACAYLVISATVALLFRFLEDRLAVAR